MFLFSEPLAVGYDSIAYTTSESAGNVTLTIRVFSHALNGTNGAPRPFTLRVTTGDGNASMCFVLKVRV